MFRSRIKYETVSRSVEKECSKGPSEKGVKVNIRNKPAEINVESEYSFAIKWIFIRNKVNICSKEVNIRDLKFV